jgi:enoyl-CoA hydratase
LTDNADDPVLVDFPAEGVVRLTLNRPGRLNALSYELFTAIEAELERADADPACRVIVVTGAGRGFCAGLDITSGFAPPEQQTHGPVVGGMRAQERVARILTAPRRLRVPVIAAVNGPAAGGGLARALACDVRVAARAARFNVAFVRIGLSGCDCGVSYLLPRAIGTSAAFELMLTGRVVESDEALRIGLVGAVVPDEELQEAALATAALIVRNSPFGVEMTKQVMWTSLAADSLEAAIAVENRTQILCTQTKDMTEALAAFSSRRSPAFNWR